MMEARKVQKVGYSTLIVSLPKDWVEEVSLKQGDIVTFRRESDGGITVYPGLTKERENHRYMIDADLCDGPNLLTRIITANYLTGHDTIQIILSSMLEQAVKSVVEGRTAMADEVLHMEEEADRIYWMIIRQLLLAVLDRRVAKEVGIEGPMHVVGNRVIAKSLEQMADSASHVALEAQKLKGDGKNVDTKITKGLLELSDKVRSLIEDSFNALMKGDLKKSNECIERVVACEILERSLTADLMKSVKDVNLAVGLRSIIWDVGQMARDSVSIAEVGINRKLETPSDFCQWEKV